MININYLFAAKNKIILFIICIGLFSCGNNNKDKPIDDDYTELIKYLNENREEIIKIGLSKPVFYINLKEDNFIETHKKFNSNRLNYFIAILEKNETAKKEYYEIHRDHERIFDQYELNWAFYDCFNSFDYILFDRIGKKYTGIKIPVDFIKEYKMNYRQMTNQEYIKDRQY
ncbi:MAG: hypothetical protein LBB89_09245 [Treponema sp.]|jgi:hypothetical protein|nr:hypothetical protein [Treponema sp.]